MFIKDYNIDNSISLEECVKNIRENVDPEDFGSICDASIYLRMLANNRTFLYEKLSAELFLLSKGESVDLRTPQSIQVYDEDTFYIRANIWPKINRGQTVSGHEKNLFSYEMAHDHNFHFMTVGYFGPGYETDIYNYDYNKCLGFHGESIDLTYIGREKLVPGRVFVYEGSKDVHIQREPSSLSISLNILFNPKEGKQKQQYRFDVKNKIISGSLNDEISCRLFIMDVLKEIGNEKTCELLLDVARNTNCGRTHVYALRAASTFMLNENTNKHFRKEFSRFFEDRDPVHAGRGSLDESGRLY
ncbi:hypothetical protein [Neokomagataea thailandica]|uniref:Transposase n=1 Tax=Neokomagataea tanensis NBRC 106556 TaxID=1223519 RepID=A0ABQ0QLT6_9PROT|nr:MULTISPECIES: hypothetical protein [Neokomagataea]GBR49571.1 transposase [Neokomagataea tanensis NBRC 106556]